MRCSISLLLLLSGASQASAQFLRLRTEQHSYAQGSQSSLVSSFTWGRGADGEMHDELEQTQTDVTSNSRGAQSTESKTSCADGLCQQQLTQKATSWSRLKGILMVMLPERPQHVAVIGMGRVQAIPLASQPPNLRSLPSGRIEHTDVEAIAITDSKKPWVPEEYVPAGVDMQEQAQFIVMYYVGTCGLILLTFFVLSKIFGGKGEVTTRSLAEPLAPVAEEIACGPAVRAQPAATESSTSLIAAHQKYLRELYIRAQKKMTSKAEAQGVQQYLSSLYQRALMAP